MAQIRDAELLVTALHKMEPLESLAFRQFQLAALLYEKTENPETRVLMMSQDLVNTILVSALERNDEK